MDNGQTFYIGANPGNPHGYQMRAVRMRISRRRHLSLSPKPDHFTPAPAAGPAARRPPTSSAPG
jgi:hypothetical protein